MLAATYARGDADQILVTTGAIEANYLLFNVLLEPGDHVIAPYPAYQQLYSVPRAIGCDVSLWHVGPGDRLPLRPRRARAADHAEDEAHRRQHAAQSDRRDAVARRRRGGVRAWPIGRRDGDGRRGVSLARRAGRSPFAPPMIDLGAARHQRRHAVEAVRPARGCGSAGSPARRN